MKVTVFHCDRAVAIVDSPYAATLEDYHLEYAYKATQNGLAPWSWGWQHSTVTPTVPLGPCRSTGVGDEMELENGRRYRVDPVGFSRIAWKEEPCAV